MQTDKLVDVVENFAIYGYDASIRDHALQLLKDRGVQTEDLVYFGKDKSKQSRYVHGILETFNRNSVLGLIFYIAFITQLFVQPTEENILILTFGRISTLILLVIFLIGATFSIVRFNKVINKTENGADILIFILVGMPLFIFVYLYFKRKMKEDLSHLGL